MGIFRSAHREPTRREEAVQGVVFVCVVLLLCGVLALKLSGVLSGGVPVTAELRSAGGGIRGGVDVKMHGMAVGKVTSVDGDAQQVRLAIEIEEEHVDQIPSGVRARVLPASVFGTSYVDLLVPKGGGAGDSIEAGDTIEEDTTQGTLELQNALDSIDALVDALGPAELATALHTMSTVLDGRGDDIGVAIDTFNRYTAKFAPLIPRVRSDLRLLAVNLDAVARNAPELLDATEDTLITLDNLVERRDQIAGLLDGGLVLLQDTRTVLARHEPDFLRALSLSVTLVDALYDERGGLRDSLLATGNTSGQLLTVLENGYARVEGYLRVRGPGDYTRADCPRYGSLAGGNCG